MADNNDRMSGTANTTSGTSTGLGTDAWNTEDAYWRTNYSNRPYATADRTYDYYQPAYRYGYESANRYRGRNWDDVQNDLRSGWDTYNASGTNAGGAHKSTWDEIKDATKDAWDKVTGHGDPHRRDR